jgi:DNA-binding beta-propeller fold protein YncE
MICASNATPNAESETATAMSAFIKTLVLITAALSFGFISDASFGAEVLKFSYITSIYAAQTGTAGQVGTSLNRPEGIACDDQSHVIVADTGNGRLLRYILRDQTISGGSPAIQIPELAYPTRVQLNSKGEIFVLDRKKRRIVRLTPAGAFSGYLNPTGLPSPTYVPRSFCIDRNDAIYVLDIFSERILVLNAEGRYLAQKKFPKDYGFFSDLTVDFKGTVFLIDSINATVFSAAKDSAEFSPLTKNLKEYMRFPTAITADNRGHIYLVDHNGSRIIILGPDGSFLGRLSAMGWKEGLLNYPSQLCINNRGKIFISDTNNNRIQVFAVKE